MKRMVVGVVFVSLLLISVSGWVYGFERREPVLDAFSRHGAQLDSMTDDRLGIGAVTGEASSLTNVAVATAGEPAMQDDHELQRRRDVRQRRGMPMPADAGLQQPPQVTIPVVIEPPSTEAPPAEEPQKTFEQDNQELLKALKRGGGQ